MSQANVGATSFHTLRKIVRTGGSHRLALPVHWVRDHLRPAFPYVIVTPNKDGTLTVSPAADAADAIRSLAPTPGHHQDR